MDIKGRWALVTGASRGVGSKVATVLAEKGCRLLLHSRKIEGTQDLLDRCKSQGLEAHSLAAELSDPSQVEGLIEEVRAITGGTLDILYNNAAIMTPFREKYSIPWQDYQESFQVNLAAPAKLADAFIPAMLQQDWGRIVMVTSGIYGIPELMPYSCSKAALDRYVRDMVPTLEGSNVLINLMDPGWLRTDLGGPEAPNSLDSVLPGALVPLLLTQQDGSGKLYQAQDYSETNHGS